MFKSSAGVICTCIITSGGGSWWLPRQGYAGVEADEGVGNEYDGGCEKACDDWGDRGTVSGATSGRYQGPSAPLMACSSCRITASMPSAESSRARSRAFSVSSAADCASETRKKPWRATYGQFLM